MTATWPDDGLCRRPEYPPEMFFPDRAGDVRAAKAVCERCPVKDPCLDYALANFIGHGVWGGTSERQRRALRRERRLTTVKAGRP